MVEPGIGPGTSWLVVRSSDLQAMRLVKIKLISLIYHLSDPRDLLNLTEIQWSHGLLSMLPHMLNMQNTVK